MTTWFRRLPKFARLGTSILGGALLLVVAAALVASLALRGRRFGRLVEALLPPLAGQVHVGGGAWSWGAVLGLVRGRAVPVSLDDVQIVDPEGTEVLFARHLAGQLEVHRGPARIRVTRLELVAARWRFARMRSRGDTGFLAAFASPRSTGPERAGARPASGGGVTLSLAGVHLDDLEATFDLPEWGLHLRDVHGTGGLDLGAGPFTFEVGGAEVRGGGELRIGHLAPVAFGAARLDRVATSAAAPDAIRLHASAIAVGASQVDFASTFDGVYGVSRASARPSINARLRARAPADLLAAFAAGRTDWRATGSEGTITIRLAGPFQALTVEAEARALDLANGRLEARDVGFDLAAEPSAGRFRVRRFTLRSPAGGHVVGDLTLAGPYLEGDLTFAQFTTAPFVPDPLRPFAGGTLDGRLKGHLDLGDETFALDLATLVLHRDGAEGPTTVGLTAGPPRRRAPRAKGPTLQLTGLHVANGAIVVPRLALAVFGAELVARGRVRLWDVAAGAWLAAPEVTVDIGASRVSLERLTGLGFARGTLSFAARVRGSAQAMTLNLRFPAGAGLTVLDEPFSLPRETTLRLGETGVLLDGLRLVGPRGSTISTAGRIAFAGALAVDVAIDRFPLDRLPGFARTELPISGFMSADVHLRGDAEAPALRGQVSLNPVTFQDRPVGGGTIVITPGPKGSIRARGHLIDGISVEGSMTPKRDGLAGEATVTLEHVRLDPFLPDLPGGLAATGVLSGRLTARVAPGQPVTADGRLSELALLVTPPRGPGASQRARGIELHAEGGIPLAARSGAGPISLGPAHFAGSAGAFDLWGERRGEAAHGTLRGRIQLAPLAPLLARWTSRLTGAVDVDLAAAVEPTPPMRSVPPSSKVDTRGSLTVAAPIDVRLVDVPIEARVTSGVARVTADALETTGLAVSVHGDKVPFPPVTRLDGRGRVSARLAVDGAGRAQVAARIGIEALDLYIRELGTTPIHATGGTIDLQRRAGGDVKVTRIDLPLSGELKGVSIPPVFVERGRFAARASGEPDRAVRLAGTVTLDAARIRPESAKPPEGTPSSTLERRRALERVSLDLRLRAPDGAVIVEVPRVPDLTVGLDMHVGGTAAKPTMSGEPRGATLYSRFALALWRLFR